MHSPDNPFFTKILIPDEYFCDREKETRQIIDFVKNGYDIVLKSPRRIGKSSLIMHVFNQEEIRQKYNTLFVDIYGTKNMWEFTREFQSAFLRAPFAKGKRGMEKVRRLLMGAYLQVNLTPDGVLSGFQLGVNPSTDMSVPLQEMFSFLEKTDKPNLVVFDEFQTVLDYPEKAAAIIRSLVQKMVNTTFIFSGSSRHLLDKMFEYPNEPFYKSATPLNLGNIPMETYRDFCVRLFQQYGKDVEASAVERMYSLFSAGTYDMQEVMKGTFYLTRKGKTATWETILESINDILDRRDIDFRDKLNRLPNQKERATFFCIAREGIAIGMTSSKMLSTYHLDNASSVQYALTTLDEKNLIKRVGSAYMLRDRFFELWIARAENRLVQLTEGAQKRYEKECSL